MKCKVQKEGLFWYGYQELEGENGKFWDHVIGTCAFTKFGCKRSLRRLLAPLEPKGIEEFEL